MPSLAHIRRFREGEESALLKVRYSAIHLIARRDYSEEQLQAWAPRDIDMVVWCDKIHQINPFVAELSGQIVGYADLQSNGYINHFFVSGTHPNRGIGTQLMRHLLAQAEVHGMHELTSDVSRTAQPFFERFGFSVVEQRFPELQGVVLPNALMRWPSQA